MIDWEERIENCERLRRQVHLMIAWSVGMFIGAAITIVIFALVL